jgi:hypothetical protein
MRERPQWAVAGADKAPLGMANGTLVNTSVNRPSEWMSFEQAVAAALMFQQVVTTHTSKEGVTVRKTGYDLGYMLHEADPLACIDLDVKNEVTHPNRPEKWTSPDELQRHDAIVATMESYTERSRSGVGRHVWVRAEVGPGCKRDGVELYSRQRFIICTGDVVHDLPVEDRQDLVSNMASRMRPQVLPDAELRPDEAGDDLGCCIAAIAVEDTGEMGRLMRGDWQGRDDPGGRKYPSQSEADFALLLMLGRLTESNGACRGAFRLSVLGKRDKARRDDRYLNRTLRKVRAVLADEAFHIAEGSRLTEGLFWLEPNPLDALRVDWETQDEVEVPDVVEALVADEEVTLLGGHGGIGKGFLAFQIAAAVATGTPLLHRPVRQARVLYYSAEDGRKRLTRRLRTLVDGQGLDRQALRENLLVLDASDLEPLYGETVEQVEGKRPSFVKMLGPRADFANLQSAVEAFDPQLVVIDGASDTFDGNEIARREVRAFIKLLRRVHPTRKVGVLLIAHIDRSSARGNTTNDDGYAGSAAWHNSCRRRLFLQQEVKREKDEFTDEMVMVPGDVKLRIMKNQDGPPDPDLVLSRGLDGFWQVDAADLSALLPSTEQPDHGPALLRLIASYYQRGQFISTSLAPNATTGVFATLNGDPEFPRGLSRKKTEALVRKLQRVGLLVEEPYTRRNRSHADRWAVIGPRVGAA